MAVLEKPSAQGVLRLAEEQDFGLVRECLAQSGFDEHRIPEQFKGMPAVELFWYANANDLGGRVIDEIVRLFLLEQSVRKDNLLRAGLSPDCLAAMLRLDLLRSFEHAPEYVTATVRLSPVEGLILAADRNVRIDGPPRKEREDAVYDPLDGSARDYTDCLPRQKCARFLELCAGTGVAGLMAAKGFAEEAWLTDITDRSLHFAAFNARLNQAQNVEILKSDLFESLSGMEFDFIVAHPPYLPSLETPEVYKAGGTIGDELLRKIVEGLPEHLSDGGIFYAHALASDRYRGEFETQLRDWLGANSCKFDVVVVVNHVISPVRFCRIRQKQALYSSEQAQRQIELFEASKVLTLLDCSFILRRRRGLQPVRTVRQRFSQSTKTADMLGELLHTARSSDNEWPSSIRTKSA
jgi:hypothetical protein